MGPLDQLNHLLNFLAPAFVVGALLAIAAPIFYTKRQGAPVWYAQCAINTVAGCLALLAGLWYFGHDGKMVTYIGMLFACALSQTLLAHR
jgi:hypothetical protein